MLIIPGNRLDALCGSHGLMILLIQFLLVFPSIWVLVAYESDLLVGLMLMFIAMILPFYAYEVKKYYFDSICPMSQYSTKVVEASIIYSSIVLFFDFVLINFIHGLSLFEVFSSLNRVSTMLVLHIATPIIPWEACFLICRNRRRHLLRLFGAYVMFISVVLALNTLL